MQLLSCSERTPDGDDHSRSERQPRDPNASRHDRLAQRYDDHEAVALGEVPRVDPEARNTTDERHAVADRECHGPVRTLGEAVEESGHDEQRPKAPGTASEATNMAAIEVKTTIRAGITSSAGTALVSHEYTAHDDHSTANSATPCNTPTQVR